MSDTNNTDDTSDEKSGAGRKPLTLSRGTGSGTVRQSFSHGRTKQVVVEKKKRKIMTPAEAAAAAASAPEAGTRSSGPPARDPLAEAARKAGLSREELVARQRALEQKSVDETRRAEEGRKETEQRQRRVDEENRLLEQARLEEDKRKAEELARAKEAEAQEEEPLITGVPVSAPRPKPGAGRQNQPSAPAAPIDPAELQALEERREKARARPALSGEPDEGDLLGELGGRTKKARIPVPVKAPPRAKGDDRNRRKLTVTSALTDSEDRQRSLRSVERARQKERERRAQMTGGTEREKIAREVIVPEAISVQDLANRMAEKASDIIKYMMRQGQMVRISDMLDADTAELIAGEFGHTVRRVAESDVEEGLGGPIDDDKNMVPRPAVVTIMGHVDHGKTSLLDAMRATDVVSGEAGGITQHIGAYQVTLKSGEKITFLDTPGHAAFSAMRARGANVTDIVILVVAGDDGVMPQTIEAINHAKAAGVPMIVAVNKMDKPGADPSRVYNELLRQEVVVEAMGGDVQTVEVSALKKTGLDALTEAIVLQSEVLELKANPERAASGVVIESQLDKGRGPVATVLVERGTLKRGDIVVAGAHWGRLRALVNERGQQMQGAEPSVPVEILGLDGPPDPGDPFVVVDNEARAREITDYRIRKKRNAAGASAMGQRASLEQMLNRIKENETKEATFVVKADVQGSVEAISGSLEKIGTEEVRARVVHGAVGGISESDVLLAKTSSAPIIAFNVRASKQARELAEREGVEIRYYAVIYDLIDDVKATLSGMLAPEKRETFLGYAQILQVFSITKVGKVAGCRITEGVVKRGCGVRLLRDDVVIHEGRLSTLKRFKDEVPEVKSGMECGMAFEKYDDIREGDQIECFQVEEIKRSL
jgi:translation initiation factor IF-2